MFDTIRSDLKRYWKEYPSEVPLWARVFYTSLRWEIHAILIYRFGRWVKGWRVPNVFGLRFLVGNCRTLFLCVHYALSKFSEALSGIRLSVEADIGPGLWIPHSGNTGVQPFALIGRNFTIFQGASVAAGFEPGMTVIGDNVYLGTGAKIVGPVRIANNVVIGANAVVTSDLPDDCVAVGVPAKVIKIRGREVSKASNGVLDPVDIFWALALSMLDSTQLRLVEASNSGEEGYYTFEDSLGHAFRIPGPGMGG